MSFVHYTQSDSASVGSDKRRQLATTRTLEVTVLLILMNRIRGGFMYLDSNYSSPY
jgi:hypothetical protein